MCLDHWLGVGRESSYGVHVGSARVRGGREEVSKRARKPLKILFLAAEVIPFAKTGGLADVAGSLPKAIKALGHDIRVAKRMSYVS